MRDDACQWCFDRWYGDCDDAAGGRDGGGGAGGIGSEKN